uniref:Uncharacterized protein n=2 Tax=Arundo donax TaxID=35708 RepID=A0A0A9ES33_ARUDO
MREGFWPAAQGLLCPLPSLVMLRFWIRFGVEFFKKRGGVHHLKSSLPFFPNFFVAIVRF